MVKEVFRFIGVILTVVLMTASLFLVSVYYGMQQSLTDAGYYIKMTNKAAESGYFELLTANADRMLRFNGSTGGADEEVFDGILTVNNVRSASGEYIKSVINGSAEEYYLTDIMGQVKGRLLEYYDSTGDDVAEYSVDRFVEYLNEETVQTIKLPFLEKVYPYISAFLTGHDVIIVPSAVSFFILLYFMLFLLLRKSKDCLRWTCCSVAGAGVMFVISAVFLLLQDNYEIFGFSTDLVRIFMSAVKADAVYACIMFAIFFVFMSLGIYYLFSAIGKHYSENNISDERAKG